MINYISNLPRDLRSGGFSAMNVAAFDALEQVWPVLYVGPVDPKPKLGQKILSKTQQWFGRGRDFFFFSAKRLESIANEVECRTDSRATLDFFHGFTPWILTAPPRPYAAWSDCAFHDYVDIYHRRSDFSAAALTRIEETEAHWLRSAACVIFTSTWAAQRTSRRYSLEAARVKVVGIFGESEIPESDQYSGGQTFAFISTDFDGKGGPVVLRALEKVRRNHPDASLTVVGDRGSARSQEGVTFAGVLRKEVPTEYDTFRKVLREACAVVHPTIKDISPLLIIEAAYFGCPAISTRAYAIPELIENGKTGYLLEDPRNAEKVAWAMEQILERDNEYLAMRAAAREKACSVHSKEQFAERLQQIVGCLVAGVEVPCNEDSLPRSDPWRSDLANADEGAKTVGPRGPRG